MLRALKVPSFGRLAGTYALNEIADWFASIALAVLVYAATEDALATTALFVCNRFLPAFFVPALASKADAFPTARLLAAVYLAEAVILAVLAFSTTAFLLPLVLVLAFVDGTFAATARAITRSATVALMDPRGLLREGNATLNLSFSTMNTGAPIIAGVLVAAISEGVVLGVAAALFLLQAGCIAGARDLTPGEPESARWHESLREGVAYVRGHRYLRVLLVSQAAVTVALMMIPPIYIVYVKESLDSTEAAYGTLLATWGVGMVVGGVLFARERRRSILTIIVVGTIMQAVAYLGLGVAPSVLVACAAAVFGGVGNGMHWIAVVTAIQEATEERFQTRIAAFVESLVTAAPGVGYLLGGAVTALASPRAALLVAGAGAIAALGGGLLTGALRTPPAAAPVAEPEPEPEPVPA